MFKMRVLFSMGSIFFFLCLTILILSCQRKPSLNPRERGIAHRIKKIRSLEALVERVDTVYLSAPDSILIDYDVIVLLSDSSIIIANRIEKNLVFFSRDGRFICVVGRRGEGPGEFQDIVCASLSGDRIYVYDIRLQRVSVFRMDGSFDRAFRVDDPFLIHHMAVSSNGQVYFHHVPSERYPGFVSVLDSSGRVRKVLLGPKDWSYKAYFERGLLDGGIQLSKDNVLFETNTYSYKISKAYPNGMTEEFGQEPENYRGLPRITPDKTETPEQLHNLTGKSSIVMPDFFLLSESGLLLQDILDPLSEYSNPTLWYYVYDTSGAFLGRIEPQVLLAEHNGYFVGYYLKYGSPKYGMAEQRIPFDIILYKEKRFE